MAGKNAAHRIAPALRALLGWRRGVSAMTAIRLPASFALALGATASLFWFLAMLVAPRPSRTFLPIHRGIEFTTKIPEPQEPNPHPPKPAFVKPQVHEAPAVTVQTVPPSAGPDATRHELTGDGIGDALLAPLTEGPRDFVRSTGSDRAPVPEV